MVRTISHRGESFQVDDQHESCWVGHDQRNFWDVFAADEYDPGLSALVERLTKRKRRIFIDIGAWVGAFSLYAAARGAEVIAFEPDPAALTAFKTNTRLNPDLDITVDSRPIMAKPCWTRLSAPGDLGLGLTSAAEENDPQSMDIWAATLPDYLASQGVNPADIALVKIDIEGGETQLLAELAPWLAEKKIAVRVSLHGQIADPAWFKDFPTVAPARDPYGDVTALPFITFDSTGL